MPGRLWRYHGPVVRLFAGIGIGGWLCGAGRTAGCLRGIMPRRNRNSGLILPIGSGNPGHQTDYSPIPAKNRDPPGSKGPWIYNSGEGVNGVFVLSSIREKRIWWGIKDTVLLSRPAVGEFSLVRRQPADLRGNPFCGARYLYNQLIPGVRAAGGYGQCKWKEPGRPVNIYVSYDLPFSYKTGFSPWEGLR